MAASNVVNINIEVDFQILNNKHVGVIIRKVLELLMYQRYQIPVNYLIFERYIESISNYIQSTQTSQLKKYELVRQRDLAKNTKNDIFRMSEFISKLLLEHSVQKIRFLFGSTVFTPKEIYTVHMPLLNSEQFLGLLSTKTLNKIMLSIITNAELSNICSHPLSQTNIYMDMEIFHKENLSLPIENMQRKLIGKLPANCKNVNFHFVHKATDLILEYNIHIDEEVKTPNNLIKHEIVKESDVEKCNKFNSSQLSTDENVNCAIPANSQWWQATHVIRGFKGKLLTHNV